MFTLVSTTQIFSSSAKLLLVNLLAFGASLSVLQSFISWDSARVDIWLDMYHRELWNLGDSYFFLGLRIHCSCSSCSSQFSKIKGIEKSTFFSFRTRFDTIWFRCSVFLVSFTQKTSTIVCPKHNISPGIIPVCDTWTMPIPCVM